MKKGKEKNGNKAIHKLAETQLSGMHKKDNGTQQKKEIGVAMQGDAQVIGTIKKKVHHDTKSSTIYKESMVHCATIGSCFSYHRRNKPRIKKISA